jgi:hypothetical protein
MFIIAGHLQSSNVPVSQRSVWREGGNFMAGIVKQRKETDSPEMPHYSADEEVLEEHLAV